MYLIPKDLNSKIKISKHLHLKEFILFIVGMGIAFLFDSVIAPSIKIVYYGFSFLSIGFLLLPARHNPERDNYEAIYYALIRNNNAFHAISIEETLKTSKNESADVIKEAVEQKRKNDINNDISEKEKKSTTVNSIDIDIGAIIIFKNGKMYYVKTIDYWLKKVEAYRVLNSGINKAFIKNLIPLDKYGDYINDGDSLSLKRGYLLNYKDVKEVKGILPSEAQEHINSVIDFLKGTGKLKAK